MCVSNEHVYTFKLTYLYQLYLNKLGEKEFHYLE